MALRFSRSSVELMIKLLGHTDARKKLKDLEKQLEKELPSSAARGGNKMRKGMAASFGVIGKIGADFLRTLKSAFLRTFSYGIINIVRQSMADVGKSIKESADLSLNFARVAAIMTKSGGDTQKVYDSLLTSILRADDSTMLFTSDIQKMGMALAKGGIDTTEEFNKALEVLNGLSGASGENIDSLTLQFLKMAKAFGINKDEYKEFGDILYGVSTSATIQIKDLLAAAGNVGPLMKLSYGKGIESATKFAISTAAAAQQGTRASRVGTSLRRMMDKLASPTSAALGVMTQYGIQLYKDSEYSAKYSMALRQQHRRIAELTDDLKRLTDAEVMYAQAGKDEKLVSVREEIQNIQSKINEEVKTGTRVFTQFVQAGGKFKDPLEIAKEFKSLLNDGTINAMQFTDALTKIIGRRGMIAPIGLIAGFDELLEIEKKAKDALGSVDKALSFITKQWGGMAREAATSLDKVQTTVGLIFGAGVTGPIVKSINKNILTPISETLTADEYWNKIVTSMSTKVKAVFDPITKDVGKLVRITFFPEVGMSDEDRARQMHELSNRILDNFSGVKELLDEGIKAIGRTLGKAFVAGVIEGIKDLIPQVFKASVRMQKDYFQTGGLSALPFAKTSLDALLSASTLKDRLNKSRDKSFLDRASNEFKVTGAEPTQTSQSKPYSSNYSVGGVGYAKLEDAAKIAGLTKQKIEVVGSDVSSSVKELVDSMNGMLGELVTVIKNGDLKLKENWQRQITDLRVNRK